MNKRRVTARIVSLLLMLVLAISLVACGTKHEAVKPDKDSTKIVTDKNYTESIKKEVGVQAGQVYVKNGVVSSTMVLKDTVSDADAKKLANKYATELKKTYKDMKINVQAVKKGKNVANITLEK